MNDPTLPTSITEAISAIRCDARFGDTIRALESTLAPWLAIVREVAEFGPGCGESGCCDFCKRVWSTETEGHDPTCLWRRAKELVAGRGIP